MKHKVASGTMLQLLLLGMLTLAFNIQPASAGGTVYIRPDGTVEGTDEIERDGDIYIFTGNITGSIVVERDDIVVDGEGYTVQGTRGGSGIDLSGRSNVTIRNTRINLFHYGIRLFFSSNCSILGNTLRHNNYSIGLGHSSNNSVLGNNITENDWAGLMVEDSSNHNTVSRNNITKTRGAGLQLEDSSNYNTISGNNITNNGGEGIWHSFFSSYTKISGNNITDNGSGISFYFSSNCSISGNNLADNWYGIMLRYSSNHNTVSRNNITNSRYYGILVDFHASSNSVYHNVFVDNAVHVGMEWGENLANVWDDGYPSGGNYWSDYTAAYPDAKEIDDSGIWDTPYVIDENNQDNYPLIEPWSPIPETIEELKNEIEELGSEGQIDNQGIVNGLIAKLNAVQKLVEKGKTDEAKKILVNSFIRQIQNLSGIHMTVEVADILTKSAEYILSQL